MITYVSGSASKILWLSCNSEFPFPTVSPQILDPPNNHTVVEPQDTTFSCLATGRPRPVILWVRHSDITQLLPPSVDFSIDEEEIGDRERRSNLTIIGTQPSDSGAYRCVAVNEPGINVEQATLTVHGKRICLLHIKCLNPPIT